jgi:hypothetical protein
MAIDFQPVLAGEMPIMEYGRQFSVDDLRQATHDSVDYLLSLVQSLDDAAIVFDPIDQNAHDPHAIEGEEDIGWGLGHLVAHVTASSEEWAAYSSILARGVPYPAEPRLRYETPWRDVDTVEKAVQRLEESRRIRLGYLDTWPDNPNLTVLRALSPRFTARHGDFNATACFLFGLKHEVDHYGQFEDVLKQVTQKV